MKKLLTLVIALFLVVSSAFAQTTSTVYDPIDELAPSYSVYAGVEPRILTDSEVRAAKNKANLYFRTSYGRMYPEVTFSDFLEYCYYLGTCGYQPVSTKTVGFRSNTWTVIRARKGDVILSVWHSEDPNCMMEFYPEGVVCQELASAGSNTEEQGEKLETISVGSYITFGSYEQDGDTTNGKEPIEWLVLAKKNSRMLVISRYALECIEFNTEFDCVTWDSCTLRTWLNEDFLNEAFSITEQTMIPTVAVSANENPLFGGDAGKETQDKVFLLSAAEVSIYFTSAWARRCKPTTEADAQGARTNSDGFSQWWLRTPGNGFDALIVETDGDIIYYGELVNSDDTVVRPAMWIDLERYLNGVGG